MWIDDFILKSVANHLWQSTLFMLAISALTLLLRYNSARVRYVLWLAASLKFLVPFSLLVLLGAQISWQPASSVAAGMPAQMLGVAGEVVAPLTPVDFFPAMPASQDTVAGIAKRDLYPMLYLAWLFGAVFVAGRWLWRWVALRRVVWRSVPADGVEFPVPVRVTDTLLEPGIVGVFRPVLLLPAGMAERLTAEQMRAVLAHERHHLRWRDNLAASLHMLVETVFWFHPLVWWLGARLIHERELACDEQVLREGHAPGSYAEGVLGVCEHYIASRLPCVSGVSGSDLRLRIARILQNPLIAHLSRSRKAVLAAVACATVALPVGAGIASWRDVQGQWAYRTALFQHYRLFEPWAAASMENPPRSCAGSNAELERRQRALAATVARLSPRDGDKVLLYAVLANDETQVRRLLAAGAPREGYYSVLPGSLMHVAAQWADVPVLEALTEAGLPMDSLMSPIGSDSNSVAAYSPLTAAIGAGRLASAYWFIERGADVNLVSSGETSPRPFSYALLCRDQQLITRLIQAGAVPTERHRRTAGNLGFDLGEGSFTPAER